MNPQPISSVHYDPRRLTRLFDDQRFALCCETDRMFAGLMVFQWLGGILMALVVSPRTWIGDASVVHFHVWAAVILGGAISSLPIYLAITNPGRQLTRHIIAIAQMCWSALLIHLSGGRIETHFHVFGSLAFLAFYCDWRVLMTASIVIAADHFVRGVWWPQSVFGVLAESPFRWIEHAAWVVFEDLFLVVACRRGVRESHENCHRRAILEATNSQIEAQIEQRTLELRQEKQRTELANVELSRQAQELAQSNARLAQEMDDRMKAETARTDLHERFIRTSRLAGMAEVATGVLHNVGNVLNSVNVSASLLAERSRTSSRTALAKASDIVAQHQHDLAEFLTTDARGKHFPRLLNELAASLTAEQRQDIEDLEGLMGNIEHIKEIINMQQSFANVRGCTEWLNAGHVVEDALKINDAGLARHGVLVIREIEDVAPVITDRHKVLQILVNLISNAKYALSDTERRDKEMTLAVFGDEESVSIQVRDNGVGIPRENLTRIFAHGFTTREQGHGFGLHSAALAAQDLDGSLSAHSEGPGCGASFTLRLPRK